MFAERLQAHRKRRKHAKKHRFLKKSADQRHVRCSADFSKIGVFRGGCLLFAFRVGPVSRRNEAHKSRKLSATCPPDGVWNFGWRTAASGPLHVEFLNFFLCGENCLFLRIWCLWRRNFVQTFNSSVASRKIFDLRPPQVGKMEFFENLPEFDRDPVARSSSVLKPLRRRAPHIYRGERGGPETHKTGGGRGGGRELARMADGRREREIGTYMYAGRERSACICMPMSMLDRYLSRRKITCSWSSAHIIIPRCCSKCWHLGYGYKHYSRNIPLKPDAHGRTGKGSHPFSNQISSGRAGVYSSP